MRAGGTGGNEVPRLRRPPLASRSAPAALTAALSAAGADGGRAAAGQLTIADAAASSTAIRAIRRASSRRQPDAAEPTRLARIDASQPARRRHDRLQFHQRAARQSARRKSQAAKANAGAGKKARAPRCPGELRRQRANPLAPPTTGWCRRPRRSERRQPQARRGAPMPLDRAPTPPPDAPPQRRRADAGGEAVRSARHPGRRFLLQAGGRADRRLRHQSGAHAATATPSWYAVVAPELLVNSNWSRHELTADLRGSYTSYDDRLRVNRPSVDAKVNGRIDVTRDTRIDLEGRFLIGTDNPGSPNIQADLARLPIFTTLGGTAGSASASTGSRSRSRAASTAPSIRNSHFTDGTTASNADRNYNRYRRRAARELRAHARRQAVRRGRRRPARPRPRGRPQRRAAQFRRPLRQGRHDLRALAHAHRRGRGRLDRRAATRIRRCRTSTALTVDASLTGSRARSPR